MTLLNFIVRQFWRSFHLAFVWVPSDPGLCCGIVYVSSSNAMMTSLLHWNMINIFRNKLLFTRVVVICSYSSLLQKLGYTTHTCLLLQTLCKWLSEIQSLFHKTHEKNYLCIAHKQYIFIQMCTSSYVVNCNLGLLMYYTEGLKVRPVWTQHNSNL